MTSCGRAAAAALVPGALLWVLLAGPAAGAIMPAIGSVDALEAWYEQAGPAQAMAVLVRDAAVLLAMWLLAASLLEAAAARRPVGSIRWLADVVAPSGLQRLVRGAVGVSALALPMGPPLPDAATEVAVMQVIEDDSQPETAVMTPLEATEPVPPTPADPSPAVVEVEAERETIVVEPGDSMWSIAEAHLREATEAPPSEQEVTRHWARLVQLNHARLVDPGNADLIFPGQELLLPPR